MSAEHLRVRAVYTLGLVAVALSALVVRLGTIQLRDHDRWTRRAQGQHWSAWEEVPSDRGVIYDRRGRILAHTVHLPSVAIDPHPDTTPDLEAAIRMVSEELGLRREDVRASIERGSRRFAYLARHVEDRAAVARLEKRAQKAGIRGIIVRPEPKRKYPGGTLAAHVLGFTGRDTRGREGIERRLDERLAGQPGRRLTWRDGRGARLVVAGLPAEPRAVGGDVHLTLDAVIQSYAEEAVEATWRRHGPISAVAGVVDVRTGEILALAARPTFDPHRPGDATADDRRNRFFVDASEPGSTIKPLVMALALESGAVRVGQVFDCSGGTIRVGRRTIREDERHDYGLLTASEVIARSSNVGMVQVGMALGPAPLHDGLRQLGFGTPSAVRWPAEASGTLRPVKEWREHWSLPSVCFGHEIAATPAQLLSAYATVAGGGVARPLRLVLDEPSGPGVQVLSEKAVREIVPMMEMVLATGTAKAASLHEYRVAGKTGTPQKIVGRDVVGVIGSFACFGPAEQPRLAVLVTCDEPRAPGYGSVVAAPYATELLRRSLRYLDVAPLGGAPASGSLSAAGSAAIEEVR